MPCLVAQSCPTLCDPMDCSPPGSSVHWILQARILEWVAMPSSRRSSPPRDQTQVSYIAGRFFTVWATGEACSWTYTFKNQQKNNRINSLKKKKKKDTIKLRVEIKELVHKNTIEREEKSEIHSLKTVSKTDKVLARLLKIKNKWRCKYTTWVITKVPAIDDSKLKKIMGENYELSYVDKFEMDNFPEESVQFSRSVVFDSLWPHESQHIRPPCPSPTPGVHSDWRPSSQWCHPAISSSVVPFSSCPQSLPASES